MPLVSPLSRKFIAGRSKAALLFCLPLAVLFFFFFHFFLARFFVVVSNVSICLVCYNSIVAICSTILAARFAFCLCFILFVLVVRSYFYGEPKQSEGRGLVNCKLV